MPEALNYELLFNRGGGFFETVITALYRGWVVPGDAVIDGGAHIGTHTGPLARCVGETGKVFAVEALPHLAEGLRQKFPHDKFPQIDIYSCAIGNVNGTTEFNWIANNEGYSGVKPRDYPPGSEQKIITVPIYTLDSLIKSKDLKISFIKLDLEGGEFSALQGARNLINTHRPIIAFENGLHYTQIYWNYTKDEFFQFFDNTSYTVYDIFLRKLSPDQWRNPNRWPWNFIGIPRECKEEERVISTVRDFLLESQAAPWPAYPR